MLLTDQLSDLSVQCESNTGVVGACIWFVCSWRWSVANCRWRNANRYSLIRHPGSAIVWWQRDSSSLTQVAIRHLTGWPCGEDEWRHLLMTSSEERIHLVEVSVRAFAGRLEPPRPAADRPPLNCSASSGLWRRGGRRAVIDANVREWASR